MNYQRVLTIQDISCVGQCSTTVALPILSACGLETAILPSAILSTHTGGFRNYTVHDLSAEMPKIVEHWQKEKISFASIYTGYLGTEWHITFVKEIFQQLLSADGLKIVDPAMADQGKLYPAFDMNYARAMATLVALADIVLPNISEACLLSGSHYREKYDEAYIRSLIMKMHRLGAKKVVLTGVSYAEGLTGVAVSDGKDMQYYAHPKFPQGSHGTGDVYASCFVGMYLQGKDLMEAARIAADYTYHCIQLTKEDATHWYGVKFEACLKELTAKI